MQKFLLCVKAGAEWHWTDDPVIVSILLVFCCFFFVRMTGNIHWTSENSSVKFQHYNLLLHCSLLHILIIFLNIFFNTGLS